MGRDWITWERYQVIHQGYMSTLYAEGIVTSDTLEFVESCDAQGETIKVRLVGEVVCRSGVRSRVLKWMRAERRTGNRLHVLTDFYQNHAWRPRGTNHRAEQAILRYDQAHGELHRHHYDGIGEQIECEPLTSETMPTLDFVIREADALGGGQHAYLSRR